MNIIKEVYIILQKGDKWAFSNKVSTETDYKSLNDIIKLNNNDIISLRNNIDELFNNIINANIYSSKSSIIRAIRNKTLTLYTQITFIDISRFSDNINIIYDESFIKNHIEIFNNYCCGIIFSQYPLISDNVFRYECYGMYVDGSYNYIRYELNSASKIYNFGDVVEFISPYDGNKYEGIILYNYDDNYINQCDVKPSGINDIIKIHYNDIINKISTNISKAKSLVLDKYSYVYTNEYKNIII